MLSNNKNIENSIQKRGGKISIALSFDDNYSLPARVMIKSLTYWNKRGNIFLIHSSISQENIKTIGSEIRTCGWNFYVIKIPTEIDKRLNSAPITYHFSKAMYYRLFLPWILKDENRILYLDVDTFIRGELTDIFEGEYGENLIAAVPEMDLRMRRIGRERLKLKEGCEYFNSGVQLIFLEKIRNQFSIDYMIDTIERMADQFYLDCPDQDIMNKLYEGKIFSLSKFYNYGATNSFVYKLKNLQELKQAKIVHFIRAVKPWNAKYSLFYIFEYWRYLKSFLSWKEKISYWLIKPFYFMCDCFRKVKYKIKRRREIYR